MSDEKKPFWAKCGGCNHCWPCAYLPMSLERAGKLLQGLSCPMCGADSEHVFVAKQHDGKLLESVV